MKLERRYLELPAPELEELIEPYLAKLKPGDKAKALADSVMAEQPEAFERAAKAYTIRILSRMAEEERRKLIPSPFPSRRENAVDRTARQSSH